jgi:hypothetical protein
MAALGQLSVLDRELANAFTHGGEQRVADCRHHRWHARLADSARGLGTGHDMDFDNGHLMHPEHRIIAEVALLHAAILERDRPAERRRRPKMARPLTLSGVSSRFTGLPIRVKACGSLSSGCCGTGSLAALSADSP